tara:strand:+ start:606 stop:860 length:255 start_codon:yes stop_codon:yes gene_type:complete
MDYNSPENKARREVHWQWIKEIKKYLPQVGVKSHCDPERIIKWLFEQVELKPDVAELVEKIKNAKTREEELEAIFPRLKRKNED